MAYIPINSGVRAHGSAPSSRIARRKGSGYRKPSSGYPEECRHVDDLKARLIREEARLLLRDTGCAHLAAALELAQEGHGWFGWDARLHGRIFQSTRLPITELTAGQHRRPEAVEPYEQNADDVVYCYDGQHQPSWTVQLERALQLLAERQAERDKNERPGPPTPPEAAAAAVEAGSGTLASDHEQRWRERRAAILERQQKQRESAA